MTLPLRFALISCWLAATVPAPAQPTEAALRVLIGAGSGAMAPGPGGEISRGFPAEWSALLTERGATVRATPGLPTREEWDHTDVLVVSGSDAMQWGEAGGRRLEKFLKRGGGIVVLQETSGSTHPAWLDALLAATADLLPARSGPGLAEFCVTGPPHPITQGIANFDLPNGPGERFQVGPSSRVLAGALLPDGPIVPWLWVREQGRGRLCVLLAGPSDAALQLPSFRGLLLRGIAWAGHREPNSFLRAAELASFGYPRGEPSSPEGAARKIRVSREFALSLVAAEPIVIKPIGIDWDARGRTWVLAAQNAAEGQPFGASARSILVLDRTDGDGRARGRTVFADCPAGAASFVLHRDGVILSTGQQILRLRDTDGDGRADRTEVLFHGLGQPDTLPALRELRWGIDGWIYGCLSSSAGLRLTNVVNAQGARLRGVGAGLIRFQPDGSSLEQVLATGGRPSGLDFSWDGELFFSRAGGAHLSYGVVSERYFAGGRLGDVTGFKAIEDHRTAYPLPADPPGAYSPVAAGTTFATAAGGTLYEGGAWPEKYAGSFFVCEPASHLVHEDILSRAESLTFEATRRSEAEFMASGDAWFRPVQVRVGPDGAIYVVDIYSDSSGEGLPGAGSDAGVDRRFGRVWRVQHRQARHHEIPALDRGTTAELAHALAHPNEWVRRTAVRLLVERQDAGALPVLAGLASDSRLPYARVEALWALQRLGGLAETNLLLALGDPHPSVVNNALRIIPELASAPSTNVLATVVRQIKETDERTRLDALMALSWWTPDKDTVMALHKLFPDVKDGWGRSAILNAACHAPGPFIRAAFQSERADAYRELVVGLVERALARKDTQVCSWILELAAREFSSADRLKISILETFTKTAGEFIPPASAEVVDALRTLLKSENRSVKVAAYALARCYQRGHLLAPELESVRRGLLADLKLEKMKDEDRIALVSAALALPELHGEAIPRLDAWLAAGVAKEVQKHIITELARISSPAVAQTLIRNFARLDPTNRPGALAALIKRREWAMALLRAVADKTIPLDDLGVVATGRLLAHASPAVSHKAASVFNSLRGPQPQGRDVMLALFQPSLERPADLKNGQKLFERSCALCHKFGDKGSDLGPNLTGIGYRGPAALLTHILDPNRVVESRFALSHVLTRKGEDYSGLIKSRSDEKVVLRNSEGEMEILQADIASITSSGLSLMPERLEWLGEKNIRDIVAYLATNVPKGFRPLNLAGAFTADSRKGLYAVESDSPSLVFKQYGVVMVANVPFDIVNPATTVDGRNVVVLRGGRGFAKTLPQRVALPVGISARRIHVLGGVAGWGFPEGAPESQDLPAAKARLDYADGGTEEFVWTNGGEFIGCTQPYEVPGSKSASDLVSTGQLRWFSVTPGRKAVIKRIILESFDNQLAPTFVALTAQTE